MDLENHANKQTFLISTLGYPMNFGGTKINGFVFKLYNYVLSSNDLTIHKKYPRKFHNLPGRYPQFVGRTISMNCTCSVLGIASFYPAPFALDTSDSFGPRGLVTKSGLVT